MLSSRERHVESKLNLADELSRGLTATQLKQSQRWFRGPEKLAETESSEQVFEVADVVSWDIPRFVRASLLTLV